MATRPSSGIVSAVKAALAGLASAVIANVCDYRIHEKFRNEPPDIYVNQSARSGFAVVDQELELGLRSVAVPVHDRNGSVVASINAGAQSARVSLKELTQRVLPELRAAAAALTEACA